MRRLIPMRMRHHQFPCHPWNRYSPATRIAARSRARGPWSVCRSQYQRPSQRRSSNRSRCASVVVLTPAIQRAANIWR